MGLITLPTVWIAKQLVPAALLNGDFNAILNQVNGNLDASNLADLAVTTPKIAVGAVTGPKIAMGGDAQGDILFRGAVNYQRLAAGIAGQALITGGAGANPVWGDPSKIVQVVNYQTGAYATGTTEFPHDDTIPQNTEGDQYLSLAITPKSATNILIIDVVLNYMNTVICSYLVALFEGSTVNALACVESNCPAYRPDIATLKHKMIAGVTTELTFKVRAGAFTTAGTSQINGEDARKYGGTLASSITITEVQA